MKKRYVVIATLLFVLPVFMFTASCAKKAVKKDAAIDQQKADDEAAKLAAEKAAAEKKRLEEERLRQEKEAAEKRAREAAMNRFENEHVYFAYDSAALDKVAQTTLVQKAEWLRNNADTTVVVGGHCDERGTGEYNLALGDRRANNVRDFLVNIGIDTARLTTVSYGEEQPLDPGHTEEAWAKNRRAQMVIE